ncbi:MAG: hypothetical protein AAB425_01020, partial [Bdellovibrionota bacterium]
MSHLRFPALGLFLSILSFGCAGGEADLRPALTPDRATIEIGSTTTVLRNLTTQEVTDDFDELVGQFRALYGPRKYKERRFGFDFEQWVTEKRTELQQTRSDGEAFGVFKKFTSKFQDGHVGIQFSSNAAEVFRYVLPLVATPIEGRAILASVSPDLNGMGIFAGDELLMVDGVPTMELLPKILQYEAWGNEVSNQHLIAYATKRPFYMTDLLPTRPEAVLTVQRPNGATQTVTAVWRVEKYDMGHPEFAGKKVFDRARFDGSQAFFFEGAHEHNEMLRANGDTASVLQMGASKPYFASPQVAAVYSLTQVQPNAESLARFGWDSKTDIDPGLFAALYRYKGKNLMLLRVPTYSPATPIASNLKWM